MIFKPEDFEINEYLQVGNRSRAAAKLANEKLNAIIESWPVVWFNDDKTMSPYWEASSRQDKSHTHKARLAFIEELPKEECKHEIKYFGAKAGEPNVCKYCAIELVATWSAK